ncbi:Cystathionine gamma-synthase [Carex littledalei]|uniref:Cystathionine gamma-synthase n=1 Tax=Carex littledalei TaxID=544730 RepID=A0A833VPU0_9POAL|nr:Cystathionine gamma-synthase [Carex littledalei]
MLDIKPDHLPVISDASLTVHAGEKQDWIPKCSIGTPIINSTARWFENSEEVIAFKATFVDMNDMNLLNEVLEKHKVSIFYADSPSNPLLSCLDIRKVSELCHSHGALVCIDSTLASPINQKPCTDSRSRSCPSFCHQVVGGCVSGSENLISKICTSHYDLGSPLVPNAAYMIIRGMKTMYLRVETQNNTALKMAQLLEKHSLVAGDLHATMKFVDSLKLPYIATSFGGCESLVQQPAVMSFWDYSAAERAKIGIKDNLVRFSFGVEKFEDLAADILQALQNMILDLCSHTPKLTSCG